jgi:HPt (histidine-containing phosphotransfer) domain-containing protein
MLVNTKNLDQFFHDFGKENFIELCNIFFEEVVELLEGMESSVNDNSLENFQRWAHRGKSSAGTFGMSELSDFLDYYAHCEIDKINMEDARNVLARCKNDFNQAIEEIKQYIANLG